MTDMIKAPQKGAFFSLGCSWCAVPSSMSFQRPSIVVVPAPSINFVPSPHPVILSKAKDLKSASWCIQILHSVQNDNKKQ